MSPRLFFIICKCTRFGQKWRNKILHFFQHFWPIMYNFFPCFFQNFHHFSPPYAPNCCKFVNDTKLDVSDFCLGNSDVNSKMFFSLIRYSSFVFCSKDSEFYILGKPSSFFQRIYPFPIFSTLRPRPPVFFIFYSPVFLCFHPPVWLEE